jgi:phosphatidylinositol alpha-1,6-mannosyltransferase
VIYPGVDAQRFRPEVDGAADLRRSLARDDEILMLTVGRLQARKGHDLVLKALGSLPAGSPVVRYAVVGDGPDGPRLKALAADLGLLSRVHFVGVVPPEALPAYYAAADIFIHPTRVEGEDFEGFGIVFLEAAAAGLPAIGGRSGGAPEAIEEGRTGELVSGTDTEELRASIVRIAASRSARTTLGKAARERVLAQFTWERAADELREIDGNVRRRGKMNSR